MTQRKHLTIASIALVLLSAGCSRAEPPSATAESEIYQTRAGSGYFTFRLQPLVPQGRVVAVDIQTEMLAAIEEKREALGVENVETVLGAIDDPALPESEVDAVLMVDAYHEFSHPREMMDGIVRALVPGGTVYLVEYKAEDPDVPMLPLHEMTEEQARREMEAVGLEFVENRQGLPWQHLLIFRKPDTMKKGAG